MSSRIETNETEEDRQARDLAARMMTSFGQLFEVAYRKGREDERKLSKDVRFADLEAHAATLSAQATQYLNERNHVEETCRMHSARVIDLEKRAGTDRADATRAILENGKLQSRIENLEKQLTAANDRIIRDDMARREPETVQDYVDAVQVFGFAEMAYEAWRELPATQQPTKPWDKLSGPERNEWRAIMAPVVECVRAEKSASITDTTKPTKPARAEGNVNRSSEKKIVINIETDGRPLSDPLVVAEVEKLLAHVKGES